MPRHHTTRMPFPQHSIMRLETEMARGMLEPQAQEIESRQERERREPQARDWGWQREVER